jgi:hypothetical protein
MQLADPSPHSAQGGPAAISKLRRIAAAVPIFLFCGLGALLGAADISFVAPDDGGTPRDPARIKVAGPTEFHVKASFEEGGDSLLRHAVSRVDLLCENKGDSPIEVTVHLDLSGDGKRTDYNTKPQGGMPLRDFAFIQQPGKAWSQINGSTKEWVASVKFQALPGSTKFGLSPWYTYADLEHFIGSLPDDNPNLKKSLLGKSDQGRNYWELVITDPQTTSAKKTIYWHAREHAYETFSSFSMEGLVPYLLSDEAADFRRRYIFVLHPMVNVDGVGQGFEYRGGHDFPDLRGTVTGRIIFDTIDRLKPDYKVSWHNWVAPRDRNDVSFSDVVDGRPSARAWYIFTQKFPSLRRFEHRWRPETEPLAHNWAAKPQNLGNSHQYAMMTWGTKLWGWEMPWWNCTVDDARRLGPEFARAFLATIEELAAGVSLPAPNTQVVSVPRWSMHEFSASGKSHGQNPFIDSVLVGDFTSPSGKQISIDGFYDGDDVWRLRFAPDEEGEWTYRLHGEGVEIYQTGTLLCTKPTTRGFIGLHPGNSYAFAFSDTTAFLPMGDTSYGLFDDSPITPALRTEYIKTRRGQRFNFVRMMVGHSEVRAASDPSYWAWGGTAQNPDLDRFNPAFFRAFDALMNQLRAAGMNVEMILLNLYRKPFNDPSVWTSARERQWLRYLIARYAAFDNIFLWTIANEYETHPDNKYRLDYPADVDWAKATARFIKANDPRKHLVTVHPVISASRRGSSPRSPFDHPWRIGEFFGDEEAFDVLSHQTGQHGEGTTWDEKLLCWAGDSATLVDSIRADRRFNKPVLNSENGYEYLRGDPTMKKQVHHTDKVRRSSWRIVCAGGSFAAGFNGTIGHSDVWNRIDSPNRYTFRVEDEGAAHQLAILHDFFAALPFWRLEPFTAITGDAVAAAIPGQLYVLYFPHGGTVSCELPAPSTSYRASWLNPRTGAVGETFSLKGGQKHDVAAPGSDDWTLKIEAVAPEQAPPPKPPFHLFLLIGQSNMAGRGIVEEQDKIPHPRVVTFSKANKWVPAVDPLHFDKAKAGVGLGSRFGRVVADAYPEVTVGLVPCAVGNTALATWEKGGANYRQALARVRAAMKDGELKGILWHQGEADSGNQNYSVRLAKMIADLREDLGVGPVYFVAGKLCEFDAPARARHKTVNSQLDELPQRAPNVAVVESAGLADNGDGTHFNSASLREFGRRYASAWLTLARKTTPENSGTLLNPTH